MHKDQYPVIAARRQNFNTLLWQTPALSIASQAFLLGVALNPGTEKALAFGFSLVALLVSIASFLLFQRLRFLEWRDSVALEAFERYENGYEPLHAQPEPANDLERFSAFRIWALVLSIFSIVGVIAVIITFIKLLAP